MAKILIVEDDEKLARYIELELNHEGYEVIKSGNGSEAFEIICRNDFDLVLLDVMLPGINGMEVLRRLHLQAHNDRQLKVTQEAECTSVTDGDGRQTCMSTQECSTAPPVILLTARDAVMDKVAGLDAGAVDYITKPFAIEELLARIRVALKLHPSNRSIAVGGNDHHAQSNDSGLSKCVTGGAGIPADASAEKMDKGAVSINAPDGVPKQPEHITTWHDLTMDLHKYRVTYAGDEITLTNREFLMLKCLLDNRDIVMGRDTLLSKVCGYDYVGETNVVDVYIRYLRSKIDDAYKIKMIHTVRGVGYVIYE